MAASPNLALPDWSIADLIRAAADEHETMNQIVRLPKALPEAADNAEAAYADTWELVAQAVESIRSNDDRIVAIETRNRELETSYFNQVRELQSRMKAVDQLLERTEAAREAADKRASQAEARAVSAEEFLRRIDQQLRAIRR